MFENPNSLIIYIPIVFNEDLVFTKEHKPKWLFSYDFTECFDTIEVYSLIKIWPINRGNKTLKKHLQKVILPNKVNVTLEIFHIKSKVRRNQEHFFFFRVEIYSSNTEVNYIKFINYYYDNKKDIFDFLIALFTLGDIKPDFISLIQRELKFDSFIYFNIIYFKPLIQNKIDKLKKVYLTEKEIVNNNRLEIYADLQGRLSLFLNKTVSNKSSKNLKLIGFRAFILRYFTWVYQKENETFSTFLYDVYNYSDYLILNTRQSEIYRTLIKLRNYSLAYGEYQFNNKGIDIFEESRKTWDKLIKILNTEIDLKSIPRDKLIDEKDFNRFLFNLIKPKLPNIMLNKELAGGHIDLSVGNQVAIEVKKIEKKTAFDELTGQIGEDLRISTVRYGIAYGIDYTKKKNYIRDLIPLNLVLYQI